MASLINRFAALSPDFAEEEDMRKKAGEAKAKKDALKVKHEEEIKKKAEGQSEGKGFQLTEGKAPMERGKPRGTFRGTRGGRGRGNYSRGGETQYVASNPKEKQAEWGDHHYAGSSDPVHPFDRHSGTGRGTEVAKRGGGRANWGTYEDDLKYQNIPEEEVPKPEAPIEGEVKAEEKKEGEKEPSKPLSKRDKKLRKKGQKNVEEKVEENLDADGTALTYKEYQAKMAEKQLPKKQEEAKLQVDTKKLAGLVAYEKPKGEKDEPAQKAAKKKETVDEEAEAEKDVLGIKIN